MAGDTPAAAEPPVTEVVLGEVVTNALDTSSPFPLPTALQALQITQDRYATWTELPVRRVVSPDVLVGVDCSLAVGAMRRVRGIGTVTARAILTGGHVLQGSASAKVVLGRSTARQEWGHYTGRPGIIEVITKKARADEVVEGYLEAPTSQELLDPGGVAHYAVSKVTARADLDYAVRFRSRNSRLKWAVQIRPGTFAPRLRVVVTEADDYLLSFAAASEHLPAVTGFCEDVAMHLWLLTTIREAFEISDREADQMSEVGPVLAYLGHLWNPGGSTHSDLHSLWVSLENAFKFTAAWNSMATRVRDIAMLTRPSRDTNLTL